MKKTKENKAGIWLILFSLIIILPLLSVLIWAVVERWAWPSLLPQTVSLRVFENFAENSKEMSQIFLSSVGISAMVAGLSVGIGLMTARALTLYRFPGRTILQFLTILPFLVPTTVFAMGIQLSFLKMNLCGTVTGVIIVHLICSLPYAVRLLEDGTRALGWSMEEQARVLGAGPWTAFWKVTFPNLLPVMLSAFFMAYIISFSQYFLTLLIGGGRVKTFTIVMVPFLQSGKRNFASGYSLIFLLITIVIFIVFEHIIHIWSRENTREFYS